MAELLHLGDGVLVEHRRHVEALRLHDLRATAVLRLVGRAGLDRPEPLAMQDRFDLVRVPLAQALRPLLGADHLALELVDHHVERGDRRRAGRRRAQDVAVVAERDLGDLGAVSGVRGVRDQYDVRLGHVMRDAVEPPQLSLDLASEPLAQLLVAGLQVRLHDRCLRLRVGSLEPYRSTDRARWPR